MIRKSSAKTLYSHSSRTEADYGVFVDWANDNLFEDRAFALSFDGVDDFVTVTDDAAIQNIFDGGGTFEAWIYVRSATTIGIVLGKEVDNFLDVRDQSGELFSVNFAASFSTTDGKWETAASLPVGSWIHVAVSYDNGSVDNDPILYIDGESTNFPEITSPVGTRVSDVGTNLFIGRRTDGTLHFDGFIDEVRLWDDIRTAAEIQANMHKRLTGSEAGLVAYYRFNEGSGTTAADSSNGNDGTISGATWVSEKITEETRGNPLKDNITSLVYDATFSRGKDRASQLTGRTIAGLFSILVNNDDGRFNSFNTSSPLSGNMVPGRPMAMTMTVGRTRYWLWKGFLDSVESQPGLGGIHTALLRGIGSWGRVRQRKVNVAMQTSIKTGAAVGTVLTEIGWPSTDRALDDGQITMNRWWTGGKVLATTALEDLQETESGDVREMKNGWFAFEDRHHRLKEPHLKSKITFQDSAGSQFRYQGIEQKDPIEEIFNRIEAEVRLYTVGSLAVLWTLAESGADSPSIASSASKDFWASYPNPVSATNAVAVDAWTTPVATTDFTANSQANGGGTDLTSDISVSVEKFDTAMKITLTNGGSSTAFITFLQARGTPLTADDPVRIVSEDATSQADFGERTFPIPGPWLPSTSIAEDYAAFLLSIHKDPIPNLEVEYMADKDTRHLMAAQLLDLSDRITIEADDATDLGISRDFYIEAEVHQIRNGGQFHRVRYSCSPVTSELFWVLGSSVLGESTRLEF